MAGYYKNVDRWGNEIVNTEAPDFNPTPINYTPSSSGNTQNLNSFVIDPNGDMYFIDKDGQSFKINTNSPLDVLTTVQPTPSQTGNTTNLNSVFKDAAGDTWVVDWKGDAIKAGSVVTPFKNLNEWHVDPNGNDVTGDGSQEKPFATIGKAVSVAGQGDQIVVHAGVYTENVTISTPNVALVGAQNEYGSLTQIDGIVTVSASGTSVKISDLTIASLVDSGSGDLYVNNTTVRTTITSSSGYLEIRDSSVQDGTITKSGGNMLIENSKIDNVSVTGVGTAAIIRDSYQDGNSTITYDAGTIYGIYNVQGGEITINAAAIPVETAALAQGLSAEMAKEAETSDFQKIGMLRPDSEASPTKVVTWDEVTGRLEVSDLSIVSGDQYKTNSTTCQNIVSTGQLTFTVEKGLAYTPLQDIIVYADANNHMHGQVVSYDAATGILVMDVHQKTGSGNFCNWTLNLDAINVSSVSVSFGSSAPTTAGVEGDEFFVTSDGTSTGTITAQYIYDATSNSWILRPTPVSEITTTSLTPQVYQGTSYVSAQANTDANVADLILLSDGSRIHDGEVKWTSHGLTVGAWYYLSQTAAGGYTSTRPTSGLVQQLFFVEDANTIHVDIEEAWAVGGSSSATFAKTVYFNGTNPTSATIFDLNNPPTTNDNALKADVNNIYIGTDGSTWTYNSSTGTYSTYVYPTTTPLVLNTATNNTTTVINTAQTLRSNYNITTVNTFGTSWNATTGVLTIPKTGYYDIEAQFEMTRAWIQGDFMNVCIFVNGVNTVLHQSSAPASGTYNLFARVSRSLYLTAGQTVDVRLQSAAASAPSSANRWFNNYFNVTEIK